MLKIKIVWFLLYCRGVENFESIEKPESLCSIEIEDISVYRTLVRKCNRSPFFFLLGCGPIVFLVPFVLGNSYRDILHCNKKPFYLKGSEEDSSIRDGYLIHSVSSFAYFFSLEDSRIIAASIMIGIRSELQR